MDKTKLAPYIERLSKAEGKERTAVVSEMSKELGIKIGDCWKALKEAGVTPKATTAGAESEAQTPPTAQDVDNTQDVGTDAAGANVAQPGANPPPPPPSDSGEDGTKTAVVLRHKTPHKLYRRAGVVLTQKAAAYQVSAEQLAVLEKDCWVVFEKDGKGDDAE
ncbi:MAG: hypothetical protein LBC77_03575 [Spirochaetaceae bacterium]|jgi:hypothetical protein|nr:hypothetical protein [Spirochaetaceae bacterium]